VIISIAVLSAFLFTCVVTDTQAASDPLAEYQEQQKKLKDEMDAKRKEIAAQNARQKSLLNDISDLDAQLNRMESDIDAANIQLQVAQNQIADANVQIEEAQARLEERQGTMEGRLRDIYMNGDITLLDVLFQSDSYADFLTMYDMAERVMSQDVELLTEIKTDKALIEEKKQLVEDRYNQLWVIRQSKEESTNKLEGLQSQKSVLLDESKAQKAELEKAYKDMEKASSDIANQIRKIQEANKSTLTFSGIFQWPVPGHTTVTSDYGMRMHPILKVNKMHTGIDIAAPNGTPICAVADGTVISVCWNNAYGNMLIIDNGSGVCTLYAHMSKFGTSEGKYVLAGDVIGYVGSTGWSTGNHLHFEVRVNGDPINPWKYLK